MAKQAEDTKTIDMIGEKPRRGRPPTGKAKSGADRMRELRQRNRRLAWGADGDISAMSVSGLCSELSAAVSGGYDGMARALAAELVRRAESNKSQQ